MQIRNVNIKLILWYLSPLPLRELVLLFMAKNSLYLGKLRRRKERQDGEIPSEISCICSALWFVNREMTKMSRSLKVAQREARKLCDLWSFAFHERNNAESLFWMELLFTLSWDPCSLLTRGNAIAPPVPALRLMIPKIIKFPPRLSLNGLV